MKDLCNHLRELGVEARLLDTDSPEAIREPFPLSRSEWLLESEVYALSRKFWGYTDVVGCVRIQDRNLDTILVQMCVEDHWQYPEDSPPVLVGTGIYYSYYYLVRVDSDVFDEGLKADFKSRWPDSRCCLDPRFKRTEETIPDKEAGSYRWYKGELASSLNLDTFSIEWKYRCSLNSSPPFFNRLPAPGTEQC